MQQRYTPSDISRWIHEFQESGRSIHRFCVDKPFHHTTFRKWLYKDSLDQPGFIPIERPISVEAPARFTLQYPNGIVLSIHHEISAAQLKILIGC